MSGLTDYGDERYDEGYEQALLDVYDLMAAAYSRTSNNYIGIYHSGEEQYATTATLEAFITDRLSLGRFDVFSHGPIRSELEPYIVELGKK